MNYKSLSLAALSVWFALPTVAHAADGDSCKFVTTTVTSGTTTGKDIPMPTNSAGLAATNAVPQIECRLLCDKTAAGAFTCGPMWVPGGGQNIDVAVVRALSGTSGSGCGYDDVNVYTLSNTNTGAGSELPSLGTLDDDGSSSGVKQIEHFGPLGPYLYLSGTATAGTCDATHRLQIQLLIYPKPAIH